MLAFFNLADIYCKCRYAIYMHAGDNRRFKESYFLCIHIYMHVLLFRLNSANRRMLDCGYIYRVYQKRPPCIQYS